MRSHAVILLLLLAGLSGFAGAQNDAAALRPGARQISGQVRLGAQAAPAGVPVILQIVSGRYVVPSAEAEVARTVTNSQGRFTFDRLEAVGQSSGREFFAVSAQSAGYRRAFRVADLTLAPRAEVNLLLQRETGQQQAGDGPKAAFSANARRPSNPEAQQALANGQDFLFRKHDPEVAVLEFRKAVKADPWYGPGYILLGLACMQAQRWSDAQWAFTEATKVEPGNAQGFLGLGSALNEQHDYAGARQALEHSLELNPDSAEAHYELARTFGAMEKWQEAAPHARRAIEINPDYAGPHALMGNIYLAQADLERARAEFQEYLRLDPEASLAPSVKQIIAEIEKAMADEGEKDDKPRP